MPSTTMESVADHGKVTGDTVRGRYDHARGVLDSLERLGISYGDVTNQLEREGVEKFEKSWDDLLRTVSDELARSASAGSPEEAGQ
jgi:transaldolase